MRRALSIALLAATAAGLALAFAQVLHSSVETTPIATGLAGPPGNPGQTPSLSAPLAGSTREAFAETVTRPLFWASRRPIAPPPAEQEAPAAVQQEPAPSGLRLAGIIHDGNSSRRALLVWPGQPAGQWLDEGASLEGWRLVRVDRFGVQVSAGSRIERLDLH